MGAFCTACGGPVSADAKFCRSCGEAQTTVATPVSVTTVPQPRNTRAAAVTDHLTQQSSPGPTVMSATQSNAEPQPKAWHDTPLFNVPLFVVLAVLCIAFPPTLLLFAPLCGKYVVMFVRSKFGSDKGSKKT